jgi:hypothetical protein
MKKNSLWVVLVVFAAALAVSIINPFNAEPGQIGRIAAFAAESGGRTWVAVYEDRKIIFYLIGENKQDSFSISRKNGEYLAQIEHMAADADGNLYFIVHYVRAADGTYAERQELGVYTPGVFGKVKTIRLDTQRSHEDVRYLSIRADTSVILTGIDTDGGVLIRTAYDTDALKNGNSVIRNTRFYPSGPDEGVYKAVASDSIIVYISKTGKVFKSEENAEFPVQIYPAPGAPASSYVSFIHQSVSGQVIIGEQKGGHILRLFTYDGRVEYMAEGDRPLGAERYSGRDILEMSFPPGSDVSSWAAAVQNTTTGAAELLINNDGEIFLITGVKSGLFATVLGILRNALLYFIAVAAFFGILFGIGYALNKSRTILIKLIFSSVPLLLLALAVFGAYSYTSYQNSLRTTYETKVADQGNLLRALFGSASFDKITSPGMYNSVEYQYLRAQMGTRDVYTSSAYFVDGSLYIGVDDTLPCLFPFGNRYSPSAYEIYRRAALSGVQQSGTITDRLGERIVCITPVGSSSGNTVFLLETGVFQAEIDRQAGGFLRNYLIIALVCIVAACILLMAAFLRILRPLGGIIEGLEQFSRGNSEVRLKSKTNDELADIARVFNKMAKDIDVQIYNLKAMGDTYYRFVPHQIFRLLGKDNLADVELGSSVEGKYCVLVANLYLRQGRTESMRDLINRFFEVVHKAAGNNGATLLTDSAGLRDLLVVCPDGDSAVQAAMEAIALIDGHNAKNAITERLDVSFLLHSAQIDFGICGDGSRYVPAMLSPELDETLLKCEEFRHLSSRLIVTEPAYSALTADNYCHRFIGYVGSGDERIGLHDFYDSGSPGVIRLLNDTLGTFNKAMELYGQGRYYDAKNIFTMVLRENKYDNVARHYIFQCEKKL